MGEPIHFLRRDEKANDNLILDLSNLDSETDNLIRRVHNM